MNRSRVLEAVSANRGLLLALTLAAALVVRLGLAVAVQRHVDQPPARLCLISGDAEGYWDLARTIVQGKDYAIHQPPRFVQRTPGFPVVLAFSQLLSGDSPFAARCLLACLGTAACGLTYWLGRELADDLTGLLAAVYTALSPTLSMFSVLILSETAFAAALLVSLIAIARLGRRMAPGGDIPPAWPGIGASVTAGGLIGVATLVRPTWLYAGSTIAVAVILLGRPPGSLSRRAGNLAALLVGVAVAMAPWTVRNYWVTGHLVPTTLWVGPSLYDGLHPGATGDSDMQFVENDQLAVRMSEYDVDREYRRRAWDFAIHNPARVAWLAVIKQQRYWSLVPNARQFQDPRLQVAVCLAVLPLLAFGVGGAWISRRNPALLVLTAGPVLLFAALHLLFVGSLRYRLPAEYPLAVLAAIGIRAWIAPVRPLATPPG